jgi:hypothetical protein
MTDNTVGNQTHLPDRKICRTRHLEQTSPFSDCLVEKPDLCKYAVRLGSGVFCSHPDRRRFEKPDPPDLSSSR